MYGETGWNVVGPRVVEVVEPAMLVVWKAVDLFTSCFPRLKNTCGVTSANCIMKHACGVTSGNCVKSGGVVRFQQCSPEERDAL